MARRISKLNSFTGRGSLEGWLRAVLAQEYVNRFRRQQRLVSLEEQAEAGVQFEAETADPAQADRCAFARGHGSSAWLPGGRRQIHSGQLLS